VYRNAVIYPGGTLHLLRHIRSYLDAAVEGTAEFHDVFGGGGSVLLDVARRHPDVRLFINDLDPVVAARFLVTVGPKPIFETFIHLLPASITEEVLSDAEAAVTSTDYPTLAAAGVILSRAKFSGNRKGGNRKDLNQRYSKEAVEQAARRERELLIGRLTVSCLDVRSYFEGLGEPRGDRSIYLDPPYVEKGPQLYTHFFTERDHVELAALAAPHSRLVVSYDDHPLVRGLYAWADCHEITVCYDGTGETKTELLFTTPAMVAAAGPGERGGVKRGCFPAPNANVAAPLAPDWFACSDRRRHGTEIYTPDLGQGDRLFPVARCGPSARRSRWSSSCCNNLDDLGDTPDHCASVSQQDCDAR
jgi:DNA adenine methylase